MSGLYIPGLSMPRKTGIVSIVLSGDGSALLCEDGAYSETKVIPVPDHGRLIDADALWKEIKSKNNGLKLRPKGESVMYDAGFLAGYRAAAQIASKMPTVIEADKEGDT